MITLLSGKLVGSLRMKTSLVLGRNILPEEQSASWSPGTQFLFVNALYATGVKSESLREGLGLQTNKPLRTKSMFLCGFLIKVSSRIRIKMRLYLYEIISYYN